MLGLYPSLLCQRIEANLEPKIQFYLDAIETDENALEGVANNPRLLTSSDGIDGAVPGRVTALTGHPAHEPLTNLASRQG